MFHTEIFSIGRNIVVLIILQKPGSDGMPPRKLQSFETNLRHIMN